MEDEFGTFVFAVINRNLPEAERLQNLQKIAEQVDYTITLRDEQWNGLVRLCIIVLTTFPQDVSIVPISNLVENLMRFPQALNLGEDPQNEWALSIAHILSLLLIASRDSKLGKQLRAAALQACNTILMTMNGNSVRQWMPGVASAATSVALSTAGSRCVSGAMDMLCTSIERTIVARLRDLRSLAADEDEWSRDTLGKLEPLLAAILERAIVNANERIRKAALRLSEAVMHRFHSHSRAAAAGAAVIALVAFTPPEKSDAIYARALLRTVVHDMGASALQTSFMLCTQRAGRAARTGSEHDQMVALAMLRAVSCAVVVNNVVPSPALADRAVNQLLPVYQLQSAQGSRRTFLYHRTPAVSQAASAALNALAGSPCATPLLDACSTMTIAATPGSHSLSSLLVMGSLLVSGSSVQQALDLAVHVLQLHQQVHTGQSDAAELRASALSVVACIDLLRATAAADASAVQTMMHTLLWPLLSCLGCSLCEDSYTEAYLSAVHQCVEKLGEVIALNIDYLVDPVISGIQTVSEQQSAVNVLLVMARHVHIPAVPLVQECLQALVGVLRNNANVAPMVVDVCHTIMRRLVQIDAQQLKKGTKPFWDQLSAVILMQEKVTLPETLSQLLTYVITVGEHLVHASDVQVRRKALEAICGVFVLLLNADETLATKHANPVWAALSSCVGDADLGVARDAAHAIRITVLARPRLVSRPTASTAWRAIKKMLDAKLASIAEGSTAQQVVEMASVLIQAATAIAPLNAQITYDVARTCAAALHLSSLTDTVLEGLGAIAQEDADAVWYAVHPLSAVSEEYRPLGYTTPSNVLPLSNTARKLLTAIETIEVTW